MLSARQNASEVDEYLREEESLGKVVPVKGSGRGVQISPLASSRNLISWESGA